MIQNDSFFRGRSGRAGGRDRRVPWHGRERVALSLTAFEVVPAYSSGNNASLDKLKLWMTKDQLQQHAEFKSLSTSSEATGSGGSYPNKETPSGGTSR